MTREWWRGNGGERKVGGGETHTTGDTAALLLPPGVVELGTGTFKVLERDMLVDGRGIREVVDGLGDNGVTLPPPGGDGTTTTGGVGITTGLTLTLVVGEAAPPPGSEVVAPPLTGKPAASMQV